MSDYLKKYYLKQGVIITILLLCAIVPTYLIYNNFKDKRSQINYSESLDITFHEKGGDKVSITNGTSVTDSVGLSSKAYTFTIKNNLAVPVDYDIKVATDNETIEQDGCATYQLPTNIIKVGIRKEKIENKIYILSDLNNGTIEQGTIKPSDEIQYTMRFWIARNTLPADSNLHYHGIIQVIENGTDIAKAIG